MPACNLTYTIPPWTTTTPPTSTVKTVLPVTPAGGANNPVIVAVNGPPTPNVINGPAPGGITVTGPAQLNIVITDGSGTNTFTPVGMAVHPDKAPGKGGTVFPPASQNNNGNGPPSLGVSDNPPNGAGTVDWDFVVLFQDQNGNFGLLDPMIRNIS